MRNDRRSIAGLALLLAAWWAPARLVAQVVPASDTIRLTLAEAQRLALSQNPAFLAESQELDIARGQLAQARVYRFNPELEFRAPGTGAAGNVGEFEAALTQEVEWAGQRGLRARAADYGVRRANGLVRNAARRTLADVSTAFFAATAAERRLDVARELARLNEDLVAATRIQAREGEISRMDANLAEIEAGRARARTLAAEREATAARLELHRLTGIAPEHELTLEADSLGVVSGVTLDADSLIALAFGRRPDLEARSRALDQYQTLARLSRREAIPNVRLGLFVEREELGAPGIGSQLEPARVGLAVGIPVPLFDRNQGRATETDALVAQARFAHQATALAVTTEVTNAVRAYQRANEEALVFAGEVLEPARSNQQLLETAFREGKIGLPTLVLLRNQLLDAELGYWDAWLAERRAFVDLQAATATLIDDSIPNPAENR